MASNGNPRYLQLKPSYCNVFLDAARREFPEGHHAGLSSAIMRTLEVSISKATIARILAGNRGEFDKVRAICEYYESLIDADLWLDACEPYEGGSFMQAPSIDQLVEEVRCRVRFSFENVDPASDRDQSSWVRNNFVELDMVEVEKLPLEYPALNREVLQNSQQSIEDEFDRIGLRLLGGFRTNGTEILKKYHRVSIYGEPGSGKSSYVQSVALRCRYGEILREYVPVFVEIRHYSASVGVATLRTFIEEIFNDWDVNTQDMEDVFNAGRALFLFDGLDEVPDTQRQTIQFMIQEILSDYPECRFICTSRLGTLFPLRGVQKAVISPFYSNRQIPEFVHRWFAYYGSNSASGAAMLEKLYSAQYKGIRELARRPVLLNLLCLTYEHNGDFPTQRVGVFASGLSALARQSQTDTSATIANLPYFRERDIKNILARIASYFFIHLKEQILFAVRDVERIIQDYYKEVHSINPDAVDGNVILRDIEQFNGLLVRWGEMYCSFSHLTYQEYFTAEYLVKSNCFMDVYQYLSDRRWSFVIELVSELIPQQLSWEFFLDFKKTIDSYVNGDIKLVGFLKKIDRAATFVAYTSQSEKPHIQVLVRAWYFALALEHAETMTTINAPSQRFDLPDLSLAPSLVENDVLRGHKELYRAYHYCVMPDQATKFERSIYRLQEFFQFKGDIQKREIVDGWLHLIKEQQAKFDSYDDWWEAKRLRWQDSLAQLLNTLGLPYIHGLNQEQVKRLHTYYRITKLLSTCINRSNLLTDGFEEMVDSMLRLTHFLPEQGLGLSDSV
jgi:hypothetical protein